MKISEKRKQALYAAISEEIMKVRITLSRKGLSSEDDFIVSQSETKIWHAVKRVLNIEDRS